MERVFDYLLELVLFNTKNKVEVDKAGEFLENIFIVNGQILTLEIFKQENSR